MDATDDLDDRSGRAMAAVPAFGLAGPAQAADAFLSAWVFGVGWIGVQAHEVGGILVGSADAFDAIEARLSRELVESGGGPIAVPSTVVGAAPEPRRPASVTRWGMLGSVSAPMPVQLSSARHAGELISGDPELVADLARILLGFADALGDAWFSLTRVGLGGWTGATATVVGGQLTELLRRLAAAEKAFAGAGDAVGRYGRVHAEARDGGVDAVAGRRARLAGLAGSGPRGVAAWGGGGPGRRGHGSGGGDAGEGAGVGRRGGPSAGPGAERAGGRLAEGPWGAGHDHQGVASFGAGFTQGVVGMAEGMVALGVLGYRVLPVHALYDPDGYIQAWEGIAGGIGHGLMNLDEVGKGLIDLDTLRSDPARWAGKLTPELILLLATAGAAGAARGAAAAEKLAAAAAAIRQAQMRGEPLSPRVTSGTIAARLSELRLNGASPAGRAVSSQLKTPSGDADQCSICRCGMASESRWAVREVRSDLAHLFQAR